MRRIIMTEENNSGKIYRRGSISEGTVKKGSVNKVPTTNRPSKPSGQGGSGPKGGTEKK